MLAELGCLAETLKRSSEEGMAGVLGEPGCFELDSKIHVDNRAYPEKLILSDPSFYTYTQLDLQLVPRTVVVAPGGIVRQVWTGSLKPDVFAYFHLSDSDLPSATSSLQKSK